MLSGRERELRLQIDQRPAHILLQPKAFVKRYFDLYAGYCN